LIYCVVPPELGEEVYERLVEHYKGNAQVTVIFDRRRGERRTDRGGGGQREVRDRRRRRLTGDAEV
jgi:hypothetical protein